MSKDYKITLGTLLVKRIALLMSICYLINPLHVPLNVILHELVSSLESANKVIGHQAVLEGLETIDFTSHDHEMMEIKSGHNLIDFVNKIFENSDNNKNSDESVPDRLKIDKHLTTSIQLITHKINITLSLIRSMVDLNLSNGHPMQLIEPPQSS